MKALIGLCRILSKKRKGHVNQTLGSEVPSLDHVIRLDRVSFAYDEEWVLRDASLSFPAGLFTAIVGPSGVGKTTIVGPGNGLATTSARGDIGSTICPWQKST